MRLVAEEWAREAIQEYRKATEWPQNSKYFYLLVVDAIVIAPSRIWHADLYARLKLALNDPDIGDPHGNEGFVGGHIEWESDGSYSCRTETGERLPNDLQLALDQILDQLLKDVP